jgi:Family of unknown function (DUF6527)
MSRTDRVRHQFVEFIPASLDDGVVYVSIPFATAVHRCCCGCGQEVVTPLSPTDWSLVFDGLSISLKPSIGSWELPCQSHYWIVRNQIRWAKRWSLTEIEKGREKDRRRKAAYFKKEETEPDDQQSS